MICDFFLSPFEFYLIYRQKNHETETPISSTSLSPLSSVSQCSPTSPPTAAELCEFLQASSNNKHFEYDFSNLTLSGKRFYLI